MEIELTDKTVLITGGLGAIAKYMLQTLSAAGATIIVTDIQESEKALATLNEWGLNEARYYKMDICQPKACSEMLQTILKEHPAVNVALGHAGGTIITPFSECSPVDFQNIVNFNLMGQTTFAREVLSHWEKNEIDGHLIFTSSYVSRIPMVGITAYTMCKAGLEMFAKGLALEYAPLGIRVNVVSPGNVDVGSSKLMYEQDSVYRAWVDRVSPLGKRNSPQSIANAFLYLCSTLGDELDGHVLQIDQGVGLPKLG
jgi:NAD(P)-dependent dehydrogenase (short-subunit alcohol dehydrogenase family)